MNLLKSELLKLVYQRRTWGLLVAATLLAIVAAIASPLAIARLGGDQLLSLKMSDGVDAIYAKAMGAYIFSLIVGVTIMSSEFHQHTAIATFLATPKRIRVVGTKILVAALAGGVFNVIATCVGMVAAKLALGNMKVAEPHSYIFVNYPLAALVIGLVMGVMGVALGTLIRNQMAAVTSSLIWFMLVDRLLAVFWPEGGKYLPSGLITAMMTLHLNIQDKAAGFGLNTSDYLDPIPAAGLMLVYGLVFAVLAISTTLRRDID